MAALLCLLGPFGAHTASISARSDSACCTYLCTLGLLLVGALVDLFRIGSLVAAVNSAKARAVAAQIMALPTRSTESRAVTASPTATYEPTKPGAGSRIVGMLVMAALLAGVFWLATMLAGR